MRTPPGTLQLRCRILLEFWLFLQSVLMKPDASYAWHYAYAGNACPAVRPFHQVEPVSPTVNG